MVDVVRFSGAFEFGDIVTTSVPLLAGILLAGTILGEILLVMVCGDTVGFDVLMGDGTFLLKSLQSEFLADPRIST